LDNLQELKLNALLQKLAEWPATRTDKARSLA